MRAARAAIAAAAAAGLLAVIPASPASAAGEIELSLDGTNWSRTLNGTVFPTDVAIVPGAVLSGTFFVRNATAFPAWVRIGVSELTVTSPDLAVAMNLTSIGTTSDSASGSTSRLSGDDIMCSDFLIRSQPLAPGGVIRVDSELSFRASVTGTTGQNEAASITFIAEMSDVDLNALDLPLCNNTMTIGPVTGPGLGGQESGSGGPGPASTRPAADSALVTGPGAVSSSAASGQRLTPSTGSISGGSFAFGDATRPFAGFDTDLPFNTVRWWEEYAILVLLGAGLAGAIARMYTQRRWVEQHRRTGGN